MVERTALRASSIAASRASFVSAQNMATVLASIFWKTTPSPFCSISSWAILQIEKSASSSRTPGYLLTKGDRSSPSTIAVLNTEPGREISSSRIFSSSSSARSSPRSRLFRKRLRRIGRLLR